MTIKKERIDFHDPNKTYYYKAKGIQLLRPMTFTGTICPTLVGTGIAFKDGALNITVFIAFLLAALLIQAATNIFNDYFDFKKGQDKEKWVQKDEFSSEHGPAFKTVPSIAISMLGISVLLGIYLAYMSSPWIILVGVAGILCGFFYSAGKHSLCSVGLGELIGALFLGFAPTILAYVVQHQTLNIRIFLIAIPFALLIASMILTNNIRDIQKDQHFRKTLGIILGRNQAPKLLLTLLIISYLWTLGLIITNILSPFTIVIVLALPFASKLAYSFRKSATRHEEVAAMKLASQHHWVFGLLFALGVWIG